MKSIFLSTLLVLFVTSSSFAETRYLSFTQTEKEMVSDISKEDSEYFTISSVSVKEVEMTETEKNEISANKNLGAIIMNIDKLIALGTKIWEIVKKGKPVVNMSFAKPISVLPKSEDPQAAFYEMENWSAPRFKKYQVEFKNLYGMTVIGFNYTVHFQSNGTYEGKGQYLTGLTVAASNVKVSWGFEFNAQSTLLTISNHGSRENPMAGATVTIDYNASSVLRDISSTETFHVMGNGQIMKY